MKPTAVFLLILAALVPVYRFGIAANKPGPSPWPISAGLVLFAAGLFYGARREARSEAVERRVRATGLAGRATVLSVADVPVGPHSPPIAEARLRIEIAGRAPYELALRLVLPGPVAAARLVPGGTLSVKVDPTEPKRIFVEWDAA